MSASDAFENAALLLVFNATTFDYLAENDSTSPSTNLYVSLHTANPGDAGDQETAEASYTGYTRQAVVRTSSGWTVTANAATNAAQVGGFGICTAGAETVTHIGIGRDSTGTGALWFWQALATPIAIVIGANPHFAIGGLVISCD